MVNWLLGKILSCWPNNFRSIVPLHQQNIAISDEGFVYKDYKCPVCVAFYVPHAMFAKYRAISKQMDAVKDIEIHMHTNRDLRDRGCRMLTGMKADF
jgi:hypothetical protein